MGIVLWAASGVVAFLIARSIPAGRTSGRIGELTAAIVTALLLGVLATSLDFGGWRELDWRAAAFALAGSFAAIGIVRLVQLARRKPAPL